MLIAMANHWDSRLSLQVIALNLCIPSRASDSTKRRQRSWNVSIVLFTFHSLIQTVDGWMMHVCVSIGNLLVSEGRKKEKEVHGVKAHRKQLLVHTNRLLWNDSLHRGLNDASLAIQFEWCSGMRFKAHTNSNTLSSIRVEKRIKLNYLKIFFG